MRSAPTLNACLAGRRSVPQREYQLPEIAYGLDLMFTDRCGGFPNRRVHMDIFGCRLSTTDRSSVSNPIPTIRQGTE
jgi:hypothetical protein